MLTETDRREDEQQAPPKRKSKRERRRDEAQRLADLQCRVCKHGDGDHQPMRAAGQKFCHACGEVCDNN